MPRCDLPSSLRPGEVAAPPRDTKRHPSPSCLPVRGKFGAVLEGIEDSGRRFGVWVSWRCPGASTGFKAQLPYSNF